MKHPTHAFVLSVCVWVCFKESKHKTDAGIWWVIINSKYPHVCFICCYGTNASHHLIMLRNKSVLIMSGAHWHTLLKTCWVTRSVLCCYLNTWSLKYFILQGRMHHDTFAVSPLSDAPWTPTILKHFWHSELFQANKLPEKAPNNVLGHTAVVC